MMKTDDEILKELQTATAGLLMMSESDYSFEVISINGNTNLTADYLRAQAGKISTDSVSGAEVEDFFRTSTSEPSWKNESQIATARQFQGVVKLFEKEFS